MKSPRRRLTLRALAVIVALFAVDFALIDRYVTPRLDEVAAVILILILLIALIVPALRHS